VGPLYFYISLILVQINESDITPPNLYTVLTFPNESYTKYVIIKVMSKVTLSFIHTYVYT
jgi:hypothetical protein